MAIMRELRTRLWHCYLIVGTSIITASLLWYAVNPERIGFGFLLGIMGLIATAVYTLTNQKWKQIW